MSESNIFLYPGRGRLLRQVSASTGNSVPDAQVTAITNGGYSEIFAAHEGLEVLLEFVFGASLTGDVLIEKVADLVATAAGTTFVTVTTTSALSNNWNAGKPLLGYFRVKNTSGQTATVYYNNRLR